MRDPLNNLSFLFKKNVERMQQQRKNPKLLLALYDHVHPDLSVNKTSFNLDLFSVLSSYSFRHLFNLSTIFECLMQKMLFTTLMNG